MQQTPAELEMTRHNVFAAFDGDARAYQFLQTPQRSDVSVTGIVYADDGTICYNPSYVMANCRTPAGRAAVYVEILSLFGKPLS